MKRLTNYYRAAHWLNGSLVLCNELPRIDENLNYRFSTYNEEDDTYTEIYQWFITSYSESDVEWLEKSFGLLFAYSPLLDCYILCVDHWGTSWDYVGCPCYNDDINDDLLKQKDYRVEWY